MRTAEEIKKKLDDLEKGANEYEDLYEENFEAIQTVRWILDLPPVTYGGRGSRAEYYEN